MAGPEKLVAQAPQLFDLYRRQGDAWVKVRMYELRPGDLFRFGEHPDPTLADKPCKVTSMPSKTEGGIWEITAEVST